MPEATLRTFVNPLDLSYAAGLFDGEGSVVIIVRRRVGKKPFHEMTIQLAQRTRSVLDWLAETFGGKVVYTNRGKNDDRTYFRWDAYSKTAADFLTGIYPYLRVKREAAEVALAFRATQGTGEGVDFDEREQLRLRLKQINFRRPNTKEAA